MHLEHCQVIIEFALQHYWITYIEMRWFLEFYNIMALPVKCYGVITSEVHFFRAE
jgi:hypothetical protein